MKILGIRNFNKGFRYCIIESNDNNFTCINLNTENKVMIPKDCTTDDKLTLWYKDEIDRIINAYKDIQAIAIKHNENTQNSCYSNLKITMFMDCIVTLAGATKELPISSYSYNQMHSSSKDIQEKAKQYVGEPDKYWDKQFADAIMAAIKMIQDESK